MTTRHSTPSETAPTREDADREAQIEWLFGWWETIDTWIAENRPQDLSRGRSRRRAVAS